MLEVKYSIGQGFTADGHVMNDPDELAAQRLKAFDNVAFIFGGYTARTTEGGWLNSQGVLIQEPALEIVTVPPSTLSETEVRAQARELARVLASLFNQESVLLTFTRIEGVEFVASVPQVASVVTLPKGVAA